MDIIWKDKQWYTSTKRIYTTVLCLWTGEVNSNKNHLLVTCYGYIETQSVNIRRMWSWENKVLLPHHVLLLGLLDTFARYIHQKWLLLCRGFSIHECCCISVCNDCNLLRIYNCVSISSYWKWICGREIKFKCKSMIVTWLRRGFSHNNDYCIL